MGGRHGPESPADMLRNRWPAWTGRRRPGKRGPGILGATTVAGDAAVIGPMLSHFGEVKVVDPTRDFARERTIPMDANAPLEVPRQQGK